MGAACRAERNISAAPTQPEPEGALSQQPATNAPHYVAALWPPGAPVPFDEVIDVRAPCEFAEDRIPGAVNLPVLTDEQRAEVGTLFREQGPFPARKIGAAHVSENIARHLRDHFAEKPKGYRPFLYCWRGGQRSASLALVLAQVGWRVTVLSGGYRTYRAHVLRELEAVPPRLSFRVLTGATGSGKTRLLRALAARGAQVLDLEALANHRGSVLGAMGAQPPQKWFDSQLLAALTGFDPARPVWIEGESNRIGDVYLPRALWDRMRTAEVLELRAPLEARVQALLEDYAPLCADAEGLKAKLLPFARRHGPRQVDAWCAAVDAGAWGALVESLLAVHYDPAYTASAKRTYPTVSRVLDGCMEALAAELHAR